MLKTKIATTTLAMMLIMPSAAHAAKAGDLLGKWYTPKKKATIKISKKGSKYFGKIVALKEPKYKDGTVKVDKNNPDEKKRGRRLIGLNLLKNFIFKKGEWVNGTIYNPEDGKEYSCVIKLQKDGTLKVRGYVGVRMLGKTQIWKRAKK